VISFIVRRLIVTVFLLLLISLMTFAIFFLIPTDCHLQAWPPGHAHPDRHHFRDGPWPAFWVVPVLTEFTFSLHGLGLFTVLAIQNNDLPEILGVVMLTAFFVVIANLIVDILYAVVDPRVRY